jgi:hypothetical protein
MIKYAGLLLMFATAADATSFCSRATFATREAALQSGCCSHHSGVCGCSGGRKKCCDNTLSPSCTC